MYGGGIAYPNLVLHIAGQCIAATVALEHLTLCVVDAVTGNALEEHLDIYAVEVDGEVQTVGQLRERITDHHLVVLVQFTVTVYVRVTSVTGMYADRCGGIGIELGECFLVSLVDTLVVVAPEGVECQSLVGLGAVTPERRTTVEFGQRVLEETDVTTDAVVYFTYAVVVAQRDLDTLVADITYVANRCVHVTHLCRCVYIKECILGIATEVVDRTGEFTVPETEVDTGIPLFVGLPLTVLVHQSQYSSTVGSDTRVLVATQRITYEYVLGGEHRVLERSGTDTVVTYLTPTGTDLDIIQPVELLVAQERLFRQTPCQSYRGEEAPRVLGELRRSIRTEVGGNHIAVVVVVERTTQESQTTRTSHTVRSISLLLRSTA